MLPDAVFDVGVTTLERGDTLVVFTDGATESRAADGSFLGDEPIATLCAGHASSADALLGRLEALVQRHAADADQSDDIAMLALRRGTD